MIDKSKNVNLQLTISKATAKALKELIKADTKKKGKEPTKSEYINALIVAKYKRLLSSRNKAKRMKATAKESAQE